MIGVPAEKASELDTLPSEYRASCCVGERRQELSIESNRVEMMLSGLFAPNERTRIESESRTLGEQPRRDNDDEHDTGERVGDRLL